MKIEREILGVDVTIHFDDCGNIENLEVNQNGVEFLDENISDLETQAQELVNQYFESEREQAQDREFERRRGN